MAEFLLGVGVALGVFASPYLLRLIWRFFIPDRTVFLTVTTGETFSGHLKTQSPTALWVRNATLFDERGNPHELDGVLCFNRRQIIWSQYGSSATGRTSDSA